MTKIIYKYPLTITREQLVTLPAGAEILTVQLQGGRPHLWALVNIDNEPLNRCIEIFGTGERIEYGLGMRRKYISTFQLQHGKLIFHAFEYIGINSIDNQPDGPVDNSGDNLRQETTQ